MWQMLPNYTKDMYDIDMLFGGVSVTLRTHLGCLVE